MRIWFLCALGGLLTLTFGCANVDLFGLDPDNFQNANPVTPENPTGELCEGVTSEFSTDVHPIFVAEGCTAGGTCHGAGNAGGGLNLDISDSFQGDKFSGVIGDIKSAGSINTFSAAQSLLLTKPLEPSEGGEAHDGDTFFDSKADPDYVKILCWIDAGADDDTNNTACSLGEHVLPIFSNRGCTGCHTGGTPPGGLNLNQDNDTLMDQTATNGFFTSTTGGVVIAADDNSLILQRPLGNGHGGGGMVFSGTSDPDYETILCWINEGALNN